MGWGWEEGGRKRHKRIWMRGTELKVRIKNGGRWDGGRVQRKKKERMETE